MTSTLREHAIGPAAGGSRLPPAAHHGVAG